MLHYFLLFFKISILVLSHFLSSIPLSTEASGYGLEIITSKNYEDKVLNGEKDAWILAIKDVGKISVQRWMEVEFNLRGLHVRVGIIDPVKDGGFLKRKGFLDNNRSYPVARVFPYGGWKIKSAGLRDVRSIKEARKEALQSLPDDTTKIKTEKELENFVHSSYGTTPPRFPVVLFTDKRQTAALYKALTLKYSKYFNFGVMRKASPQFLKQFNVKKRPSIIVLLSTLASKKLSFSSIPYEVKAYGEISYLTVAKFLYSVHETHWKDLPNINKFKGKMTLKDDYTKEMKAIFTLYDQNEQEKNTKFEIQEITHENYRHLCNDRTIGLCVIVFVDGNDETLKEGIMQLIESAHDNLENEGSPLQYLWVNGTCHPEYGDIFGIFPETLPALLITRPRKRLFITQSLKDPSVNNISRLVTKVLKGDIELQPYARFNEMMKVDCMENSTSEKIPSEKKEEL